MYHLSKTPRFFVFEMGFANFAQVVLELTLLLPLLLEYLGFTGMHYLAQLQSSSFSVRED
jgi:hypothetical protein